MLRPYLDYEEASQLILKGRAKPLTELWKASVFFFFFFFNSIFITAEVSAALVIDPKKVKKKKKRNLKVEKKLFQFRKIIRQKMKVNEGICLYII